MVTGDEWGRFVYLFVLIVLLGGWVFLKGRLSESLQNIALWGLIFLGAIAAYGLWPSIKQTIVPQPVAFVDTGRVIVPRAPDGHYYLTISLDGTPVRFIIDTGATDVVLARPDARRIGIDLTDLNYINQAMTAAGTVNTARITIDTFDLQGIVDKNVVAWVIEGTGAMTASLLGMGYLNRFREITFKDTNMILQR